MNSGYIQRAGLLPSTCAILLSSGLAAHAQVNRPVAYEVTETNVSSPQIAAENVGPVRMVRFSIVQGPVSCRPTSKLKWSRAAINEPIRQGAQVFVPARSRAELFFDDGSVIRLGGGAFVTMQTLYSDDKGEFTEVKLNDGLASCRLKNKSSIYQVDTPFCSVKAAGPAKFRCGFRKDVEIADQDGNLTIEDPQDTENLAPGQFAVLRDPNSPIIVSTLPPDDSWEQWNHNRDRVYENGSPISRRYLPADLYLAEPDLDEYGNWYDEPHYGHVWVPRVHEAGWRPYHHGHWVWEDPFGWTWVADEPWGWAPYHYGTWAHTRHGWGWCPGPEQQYWSPAVVSFSSYDGDIAWAPLSPDEVRYPSRLAVAFSDGDWALQFSIGGCAAYYPGPDHICTARAWETNYINRATYVSNYYGYGGRPLYATNYNTYLSAGSWTPTNARFGGGSRVPAARFASTGVFDPVPAQNLAVFRQGRPIGAPAGGRAPALGPSHVRPSFAAMTPTRAFNAPSPSGAIASRTMFRSNLDPRVASVAPTFGSHTIARSARPAGRAPGAAFAAGGAGAAAMVAARTSRALAPAAGGANQFARSAGRGFRQQAAVNGSRNPAIAAAANGGRTPRAAAGMNAGRNAFNGQFGQRKAPSPAALQAASRQRQPSQGARRAAGSFAAQNSPRAAQPLARSAPANVTGRAGRIGSQPRVAAGAGTGRRMQAANGTAMRVAQNAAHANAARQSVGNVHMHRAPAGSQRIAASSHQGPHASALGARGPHGGIAQRRTPVGNGGGRQRAAVSRPRAPRPATMGAGRPAQPQFSRRPGPPAGGGVAARPQFSRHSGPPAGSGPQPRTSRRAGPPAGANPTPRFSRRAGPAAGGGSPMPQFSRRSGPPAGVGTPVAPRFSRRAGPPAGGGAPPPQFTRRAGPPAGGGAPPPQFSRRAGPPAGGGGRIARPQPPPASPAGGPPAAPGANGRGGGHHRDR